MPFWRKKNTVEPEPRYRPEYMTVRDVWEHPGTAGYVRIDRPPANEETERIMAQQEAERAAKQ